MNDHDLLDYIKRYGVAITEIEKDKAVKEISGLNQDQFKYLIQYGSIADWFVESQILVELGYPFVKPILNRLFEWLKDMRWPGAYEIQTELLLKLDKHILVSGLDVALHQALIEGDWDWVYWMSLMIDEAKLVRNDFSQIDNAYDIVLFYNALYVDDIPTFNYIELLYSWGYPRISQFVFFILNFLIIEKSDNIAWHQHSGVLNLIPGDTRDFAIKNALRQLHESRDVNSIGHLREIIPIGDTTEEFLQYISY